MSTPATRYTMQYLYDEMKDVLKYLNVRFSDMHNVTVSIEGTCMVFRHWGKTVSVDMEPKDESPGGV